ncbi:hypothetical protein GJV44_00196 [Candidatus Vallotia cooleyia]|nr:hypothetical protein GJV44_00196 [Candidatus Vallotia cooleyia]
MRLSGGANPALKHMLGKFLVGKGYSNTADVFNIHAFCTWFAKGAETSRISSRIFTWLTPRLIELLKAPPVQDPLR